jgi:hypothetical protein
VISAGDLLHAEVSVFTEEAVARGIDYEVVMPVEAAGLGFSFADLDSDGDADLVAIGRTDGGIGLWENDGTGHFVDRSEGSGLPVLTAPSGVIAGDYDGDADLDLYFSNYLVANTLMRNDGGFTFTDVSAASRTEDEGRGTGCAWGDFDRDGWLDLYVANNIPGSGLNTYPNLLYRNEGTGQFEDVLEQVGMFDDGWGIQAAFFDYDRDGDSDLYLANGKCGAGNPPNELWRNDDGAFVDVSVDAGVAACIDSMGVAVGDFDGNGAQDLYPTNVPSGNPLHMNQGDGTFEDLAVEAGCASYATGWGAVFFDYDNDSYQELYVCNSAAPNRLYDHDGSWPSVDMAPALGVDDSADTYAVAVADVDDDGDLDVAILNVPGALRLFINHEGEKRSWTKLRVVGQDHNLFAIGAQVEVRTGALWQLREVIAGSNYKGQNELTTHFGLGDATVVDEVRVAWLSGTTRVLSNLPANETWVVYPPELLGDGDLDADVDLQDAVLFRGCRGSLQPGCEMMDFDGDGDVDDVDYTDFIGVYGGPVAGRLSGSSLRVSKSGGGQITLDWSPSCLVGDDDYEVYEGTLGDFSSHGFITCSTSGATSWAFSPAVGSTYFLVVPTDGTVEGSYGTRSDGIERSDGASACLPAAAGFCP